MGHAASLATTVPSANQRTRDTPSVVSLTPLSFLTSQCRRDQTISTSPTPHHKLSLTPFFDFDSGQSHPIVLPGSIGNMSFSADGVLRCACARSIAVNPWDSHDQGITWQDSPLDRWMVLPVFRNPQDGFSFKGAWLNQKNTAVLSTSDGGKTWRSLAKPPAQGWFAPAYTRDGSVMVLSGMVLHLKKYVVEEFFVSTDGGSTWQQASPPPSWLPEATSAPTSLAVPAGG